MTTPRPNRHRWWRVSLIVLGALVLLLAIGYVALTRMFPPARLAEMLAREVQAATGRELRIDGGLSLRVLPTIAVVADDLAFGNAAWGSRKEMATVKRAAFELAIAPLLQGQLHVLSLTVDGADVLLETDPRGRPNWIFSEAKSKGPSAASGDDAPPPVHLDRLQVSNARIAYRIGLTRITRTIDIESLQILHQDSGAVLATRFGGQHRQWRLDAKTGRYDALMRNTADWPFEAQLSSDGAKVTATGSLDTTGTERATLTIKVDKAAALEPLLADAAALPMPIEASAKVQRSAALLTADALRLSIAGQLLTGKVTVHTDQAVPRIDMDLAAQSIDLAQWGIKTHATTTAPATKTPGPVFTDTPLPTITLPEYPLHANVRFDRLVVPDLPLLSAVKAEIKVEPERLVVEPLSMVLAGAPVRARIELGVRHGEPLRVKLRADADGLSLQALEALAGGGNHVRGGRANLHANLDATGHTPHGLASSANGSVLLSVSDASVLGSAAIDRNIIITLLSALLPKQEADKALKIDCAVVNLPLRGGVARINRSIALETDKVAVAASGELNLLAQTVALSFRPSVKKGIGLDAANLASLVRVEGPLHDPKIAIDVKGTAREAANIGAAVATGGLTLLGERLLSGPADTQVCRYAMNPKAP